MPVFSLRTKGQQHKIVIDSYVKITCNTFAELNNLVRQNNVKSEARVILKLVLGRQ